MIVDIHGNPIRSAELADPQTGGPGLAYLQRTYQNHPSRGLTPAKLAQILEEAERFNLIEQSELWLDIREKWGHCDAEMGKRERALLTLERRFLPPDGANRAEKKATAFLNDVFDNWFSVGNPLDEEIQDAPCMDTVILGCADAMGHGFSAQEITWRREGSRWLPGAVQHRPQNWFRLDILTHSKLRLRDLGSDGAVLRPGSWILHKHQARSGYVSRTGLVRSLAWPYLFANFSIRDLGELCDIYGLPILVGKHPANATPEEKLKLLRAVTEIGHRAGGIVPDSMMIDPLKTAQASSADLFKLMIDWAETTASKVILGQGASRDAGSGGTASHSIERREIRGDLLTTDARQVDRTLTAFGWLILALNPEGQGVDRMRCPRHKFETTEPEDLKMLAESLPDLIAVGMKIPTRWLHDKTKIPEPEEDEEVLQATAPVEVPAVDTTSQKTTNLPAAARVAALKSGADPADTPGLLAAQLAERAAGPMAEWVTVIRQTLEDADDLVAFRAALPALFERMEAGGMTQEVALGMLTAELAGRLDVQRGH